MVPSGPPAGVVDSTAIFWIAIAAIAIASMYFRHAEKMTLIRLFSEKEQAVPAELLKEMEKTRIRNSIGKGALLIALSIPTALFFWFLPGGGGIGGGATFLPLLALFPFAMGIVFVGLGLYQRRHD